MSEITQILGCMGPLTSSLLCLSLLLAYRFSPFREAPEKNKLLAIMAWYYVAMSLNWLDPLLYHYFPKIYLWETILYSFSLLFSQVAFFHIVYLLTEMEGKRRFPMIHYVVPALLGTAFMVWTLATPYETRLAAILFPEEARSGWNYSLISEYRLKFRGIYTLFYVSLCVKRILRYRKAVVEYSADRERSSVRWLFILIFLSLSLVPLPLSSFFFSNQTMGSTFIPLFSESVYFVQYAILCYNMLIGNYVIIKPEKRGKEKSRRLEKGGFETYMRKEKPYLNPKLKITDLTLPLITNRTYLSAFINKEYGMNFSRYINLLRIQELERLQGDTENNRLSQVELVLKAGFSTYQGYRKFITSERKLNKRPFMR